MDKLMKNLATIVIVFIVISGILILSQESAPKPEDISLSTLVTQINAGQVKNIDVSLNDLSIELLDGKKENTQKEAESSLTETLKNYGVDSAKLSSVSVDMG